MQKGYFALLLVFAMFTACNNDSPATQTNEEVQEYQPLIKEEPTNNNIKPDQLAQLKANAFSENDRVGRVKHSIELIQKQFSISNKLDTPKGQQTITVDDQFNLVIKSEKDGQIQETRVNLKNLDQRNGGMRLIANIEIDDLPGFGVSVIAGKPGVELLTNGEKTGEERELKIFMADRSLIEQAVPAFLQALNVVHGRS